MILLDFDQACQCLQQGKIIIYPTETFYAAGGLALDAGASRAVFAAKSREGQKPLPVIVSSLTQLPLLTKYVSPAELKLIAQFWPGPLTILFEVGNLTPDELTCKTRKVAIRQTSHPIAARLCEVCGPLSSSSANLSNNPAARELSQIAEELLKKSSGVLNLPPLPPGGEPSTLVQILPLRPVGCKKNSNPAAIGEEEKQAEVAEAAKLEMEDACLRILRPGAVSRQALAKAGWTIAE